MIRIKKTEVDRIPSELKLEKKKIQKLFGFNNGADAYKVILGVYKKKGNYDEIFKKY